MGSSSFGKTLCTSFGNIGPAAATVANTFGKAVVIKCLGCDSTLHARPLEWEGLVNKQIFTHCVFVNCFCFWLLGILFGLIFWEDFSGCECQTRLLEGPISFANLVEKGRILSSLAPAIVCVCVRVHVRACVCHVMRHPYSAVNLRKQYACWIQVWVMLGFYGSGAKTIRFRLDKEKLAKTLAMGQRQLRNTPVHPTTELITSNEAFEWPGDQNYQIKMLWLSR